MRNIHSRYADETYDEHGALTDFALHYPPNFNFGYDVVDDIGTNDPMRRAMAWCNPEGEEHFFTFADLKRWSDKTANYFSSLGIGRGDVVMVILRRHYQYWFTAVALHKLGAVLVPATFMLRERDVVHRLNTGSVKAVVCTSVGDIAETIERAAVDSPSLMTKLIVNGAGGGTMVDAGDATIGRVLSGSAGVCTAQLEREGWFDFNAGVKAAPEEFQRVETDVRDPFLLYFTSGTTGEPKMVVHDGAYPLAHIPTAKHWHQTQSEGGGLHLTVADTGWAKAAWGKLYGEWVLESALMTYDFDRFNAGEILEVLECHGVSTLCGPPTMYRMMLQEDLGDYDLTSLRHCTTAGEPLDPNLLQTWRARTGLTLAEGFGQTETTCVVGTFIGTEPKPGSMGRPSPQYTVELHDETGSVCDQGQVGEVVVKIDPRPDGLMTSYRHDEAATAEVMRDGWYHTGDMAWADEDDYFYFVGRNDDVFKSSGYRIGPFEVESVLLEHDAVRECAVTGVPDSVRGQAVKATVVLNGGYAPNEQLAGELQAWVKARTAGYKHPRVIDFVDALPKTASGKISRAAIREGDAEPRIAGRDA